MAYNGTIKEVMLGDNELYEIEDAYARSQADAAILQDNLHHLDIVNTLNENLLNKQWFFIVDSYGVEAATDNPFVISLKNNSSANVIDYLAVGMMSYAGNGIPVMGQLPNKVASMSTTDKEKITDICCCLGINDTWDNYNLSNLKTKANQLIDYCFSTFPNLKRFHIAPIGSEMEVTTTDTLQISRMHNICNALKDCISHRSGIIFVANSEYPLNKPSQFKSDGVHPTSEGSNWLYNAFLSYIRSGNFPISEWSIKHDTDAFGYKYEIKASGHSYQAIFEWNPPTISYTLNPTSERDIIFAGEVQLPSIRKVYATPNVICKGNLFIEAVHSLLGVNPVEGSNNNVNFILSGHLNGSTNETYSCNGLSVYGQIDYTC